MITISENQLKQAVDYITGLDEKGVTGFFDDFSRKQPVLLAYATAMSEQLKGADDRETLFYYASVLWKAFQYPEIDLKKIPENKLMEFEKSIENFYKKMAGVPDSILNSPEASLFKSQPVLMAYLFNELAGDIVGSDGSGSGSEPGNPAPQMDDNRGITFFVLFVLLHCLNEALNGPRLEVVPK
ncbi:MAG: hypothetical protein HYY40_04765 [Bacteroidetes bacterium]|nr:hypothetical protein [Bacteroidota bacterium]